VLILWQFHRQSTN